MSALEEYNAQRATLRALHNTIDGISERNLTPQQGDSDWMRGARAGVKIATEQMREAVRHQEAKLNGADIDASPSSIDAVLEDEVNA